MKKSWYIVVFPLLFSGSGGRSVPQQVSVEWKLIENPTQEQRDAATKGGVRVNLDEGNAVVKHLPQVNPVPDFRIPGAPVSAAPTGK